MKPVILNVESDFWWRLKILLLTGYKVGLICVRWEFKHTRTDTEPRYTAACYITKGEDLHTDISAENLYKKLLILYMQRNNLAFSCCAVR